MSDLAIRGGRPVRREPFTPWPQYSETDLARVREVIEIRRIRQKTIAFVETDPAQTAEMIEIRVGIGHGQAIRMPAARGGSHTQGRRGYPEASPRRAPAGMC